MKGRLMAVLFIPRSEYEKNKNSKLENEQDFSRMMVWDSNCNKLSLEIPNMTDEILKCTEEVSEFQENIDRLMKYSISKFTVELNLYHQVNKDEEWWKTVLGSWIIAFLYRYSLRKKLMMELNKKIELKELVTYKFNPVDFIPHDYQDLNNIIFNPAKLWNFYLDTFIMHELNPGVEIREIFISKTETTNIKKEKSKIIWYFFRLLSKIVNKKIFVHNSYFPRRLQLRLLITKRIISFDLISPPLNIDLKNKIDLNFRNCFKNLKMPTDDFESAHYLLRKFIPKSYLENFYSYVQYQDINWPKKCSKILTTNSHLSDDIFKYYIAENRKNTEINIFQHGASYGTSEVKLLENFEIDLSHKFYSWGWSSDNTKVKPLGVVKTIGINPRIMKQNTEILIIEHVFNNGHNYLGGFDGGQNYFQYKTLAKELINNMESSDLLNYKVRSLNNFYHKILNSEKSLTLHKSVFEDIVDLDRFSTFDFNLFKEVRKAKVNVCMTDSTPFLEIINMNVPVLGLWPENFESLRESCKKDFQSLKDIGVIYHDQNDLIKFIMERRNSLAEWWSEIIKSSEYSNFRDKYAKRVHKLNFNQIFK